MVPHIRDEESCFMAFLNSIAGKRFKLQQIYRESNEKSNSANTTAMVKLIFRGVSAAEFWYLRLRRCIGVDAHLRCASLRCCF